MADFKIIPQIADAFRDHWRAVQRGVYDTAIRKGWWDEEREFGTVVALMHSELSEALEAAREGNPPSVKAEGFSSIEEEFADVVIRIMDYAGRNRLDIAGATLAKMEYNEGREYRHGGKKF